MAKLVQVTRLSGRGHFFDECRQLICGEVRLVSVVVGFDQLFDRQVVISETRERRVGVQDRKRVGVGDEQADRQAGVEFLQEEKIGGVGGRTCGDTGRAGRASRRSVQRRMGHRAR